MTTNRTRVHRRAARVHRGAATRHKIDDQRFAVVAEAPKAQRRRRLTTRARVAIVGLLGLTVVAALVGYQMISVGGGDTAVVPVAQTLPPVVAPEVPDHYLSEHFRDELGECYRSTGQPRSPVELERGIEEVGRADAVRALMEQYRAGVCTEPTQFLRIPGRVVWLLDAVKPWFDEETGVN